MSDTASTENEEIKEQAENQSSAPEDQTAESQEGESGQDESQEEDNPVAKLQRQVELLQAENAELKDNVLRRAADLENFRKRAAQDKADAIEYANTSLLKDLLDSLDNFDRTVEAAATASDPKTIADGVTMINKSLVSMLESKYGLVAYGQAGEPFDANIHEAVMSAQESVAEPVLKTVYLKGYKLKNRIIRTAKCVVAMPDGSVKSE